MLAIATVSKEKVTLAGGVMACEASEIGLAPGEWPDCIVVQGFAGVLFGRARRIIGDDGFGGYEYRSNAGALLTVFND